MYKHTFKVKESEDSDVQYEVVAEIPSYDELTEEQRKGLFAEAVRTCTIKVQGQLRRLIAKGTRGAALNKEASDRLTAVLRGLRAPTGGTVVTVDAQALDLSEAQIAKLEAQGVVVVNKPEAEEVEAEA